jgi:hypothetical protein
MSTSLRTTSSGPRSASDRRRSERVPHVCESWISSPTATDDDQKQEVTSLNISRHGVGFELHAPLPLGAFYVIEIGVGDQRLVSEIRLVSCKKNDAGLYECGAEFC